MKGKLILILTVTLMFFSCGTIIKKMVGFKNPKVENKENLETYFSKINPTQTNYFLTVEKIGDSTSIYENVLFSINSKQIIYNKFGDKFCYNGTEDCSGVQLEKAFNDFDKNYSKCNSEQNLKKLLDKLTTFDGKKVSVESLPDSKYYIFQCWNKYTNSEKKLKEDLEWLLKLKKNSKLNVEILFINTDLLEDWGLKKGGEIPVKFKKKGDTVDLTFGKLPINK